ncbi:nucleoporin 88 [Achroia grisella]|uniref:nucleoporin 88 n=1 Tax=Achroia grisella TaxID=688607 RepID=UPI0027D21A45|nr:nucleoporin 88 [Achroia grisella]
MDSRLYETKLANHAIFRDIKDSLKEIPSGKLCNLLLLRDDVLYVWSATENCILCLNLKQLEERGDETQYQKLHLLSPPAFSVERIISSDCGSRLCVWGSRGVTVLELPSRWGRAGLFESGSQTVLCKSHTLDERFLYSQSEVRRVHWHPSSLSHLLVLVSDNTIRLYNIALKNGPKLVKIFTIGAKPSSLLAGKTILDSLGDTAVDFTPTPDTDALLILRGNGDVYMMEFDLDSKSLQTKLSGPLAMYPPADDNYGSESCSITALGGGDSPPLVVVATCSAALYHCLLLPNPSDKEDGDSHALYVVEAVELNILLNPDDVNMQYSYPVHLYPCTNNTYACMHAGGVHTVTLPLLAHLRDYALATEDDSETVLSAICSKSSTARHLVCTSAVSGAGDASGTSGVSGTSGASGLSGSSDISEANARFRPPVALALTPPPLPALLILCDDAVLLTRTLEPYDLEEQLYKEMQLKNPALDQDDISTILKERQKVSFTAIMQEILARQVSQPLLHAAAGQEPSPQETLQLLSQALVRLRGEYMCRQQRAAAAAGRKLAALTALAEQHTTWLADLQAEVNDTQLDSTVLKEKCALAEKHQEDIKYRCSAVIRRLRAGCGPSSTERTLIRELQMHRARGDQLGEQLRLLQHHAQHKSVELKKWQEEYKKKDIALGKSHSDTISSILQQQTSQISTLIEETKLLKDQLSII